METPFDSKCLELAEYFFPNATKDQQRECASDIQDSVESCRIWWDREPPEPDGEAYRGGEAASALAESQARIQREFK
jgi:hypothetical protein